MRFRRKKGGEDEVVSGDVVPEEGADPSIWSLPADAPVAAGAEQQDDTVDMEAVAPATAAGGASRPGDHGERADDDPATVLEQATGDDAPGEAERLAGEEADRRAQAEAQAAAEKARQEADAAAAGTTVSGASVTSPGLGSDASPAAAASASTGQRERAAGSAEPVTPPAEGPLAPILANPAVQKKPELLVVGGLAAGFVIARILKAITSPDQ